MRLTNRNARVDSDGKHNDRNFDLSLAGHIDQTKLSGNKYITYLGSEQNSSFSELELDFYEKTFSDYLDKRNEKNVESNHKERVISMDKYYKSKRTRPEDKILQLGDIDDHVDADTLWECAVEYMNKFNDLYGDHCMILDMALHVDEATPHIHIRRVWMYENENGDKQISQRQALKEMGFDKPNQDMPEGRFNNSKIPFTNADRNMFIDICKSRGVEIDQPRASGKQTNLSIEAYKDARERERTVYDKEIQELKKLAEEEQTKIEPLVDKYLEMLQNSPIFNYEDEIEELKEKSYAERFRFLMDFFENEMTYIEDVTSGEMSLTEFAQYSKVNEEYRNIYNFLKKRGYDKEYEKYKETQKDIGHKQKDTDVKR